MVAALAGVESGTVTWSVLASTQDTNDADREPNFGSFRGAVLFTPSRTSIRRLLPTPFTIFLDPVLGNVGDDGILRDLSGLEGVVLVSPWATGIEETGWTWEASFQLNQREKVSFSFDFQPDETVDLSWVTPVISTPGVVMTKGATGDAATIAVGTVATGAPGSSATVANGGTSGAAVLNFSIPRGDVGATPVIAGSSATSFAIGTGSKIFATQAGMALQVGQYVQIVSRANGANYMAGNVTAYSGTNLTVNVTEIGGTGTFTDWNINLTGVKGATGVTGAIPAISGTSVTSFTPGTGSKVFVTQAGIQGFTVGQYVRIASASVPGDYMAGNVTAYTTTSLTVNVVESAGATARTDWNISLSGTRGATGTAATVAAGAVTTGAPGSSATVTNAGTSSAAVFDFTIPRGAVGATPVIAGTSATSFIPGVGSKVFTTQAGMSLVPGQYVRIASAAVPADYMAGVITAYSGTSLTVTVDAFAPATGGIARTDWNISITGTTGAQGPTGAGAPDATAAAKGSVQLAGDLGGTAAAPTVTGGTNHGHTSAQVSDATAAATANMVLKRDAAGRAAVVAGAVAADIATLGQVQSGDRWTPILKTGAAYTFALTDETNHILSNDTVAQTYTVPLNSAVAFPLGTKIQVTRWNTGTLTLAATAGVTLNAVNANRALNQFESCMLIKVATDSWLIVDLATNASTTVAGAVMLADNATAIAGVDATKAVTPASNKAAADSYLSGVPIVIQHDGTTVINRPATARPVHWIVPYAFALPTTGTTAGGTKASVDNLDLVSRY